MRKKELYQQLLDTGEWMDGFMEPCAADLLRCEELCFRLNSLSPAMKAEREEILRQIVGGIGPRHTVHSPFRCDLGSNIEIGDNFVGNYNLTILDETRVRIGDNVFIGPNVTICTIIHHPEPERRNAGIMRALPVDIADNVWIAADVTILPGVTVGEGAIIGAGSVVTKSVPPFTLAAGVPARPIREIPRSHNAEERHSAETETKRTYNCLYSDGPDLGDL